MADVTQESIRAAMDQAWSDHQHTRDQTWRTLQIEAALAAGLVSIQAQFENEVATTAAAVLVIVAAISGFAISLHHRKVEIQKFSHILNFEKELGLLQPHLIDGVKPPSEIRLWDVFLFWKGNTALFIMRMHVAIMVFALLFALTRSVL